MQEPKVMPVLPGRDAQDRGVLVLHTGLALLALALPIVAWRVFGQFEPNGVWLMLVWAALLADAWASVRAQKEAARGAPRPVNRWDLAAALLAGAAIATTPIAMILSAPRPVPATTVAHAAAMTLLSALVLVWFVRRSRLRARLPDELRGWPRTERGRPRVPRRAAGGWGTKVALGACALALAVPQVFLKTPLHVIVPLFVCLATENAASTRRATDAWWGRPPIGFSKTDLLAVAVACVALPFGGVALVKSLEVAPLHWSLATYALLLVVTATINLVRGRRRWRERHTSTDWYSVWD